MSDKTAIEVSKDDNRLATLMKNAAFQEAYERNLQLVRFEDMLPVERNSCVWQDGRFRGPVERYKIEDPDLAKLYPGGMMEIQMETRIDWDLVKAKFESFGFRSMLKDSTWKKWIDTFDAAGA